MTLQTLTYSRNLALNNRQALLTWYRGYQWSKMQIVQRILHNLDMYGLLSVAQNWSLLKNMKNSFRHSLVKMASIWMQSQKLCTKVKRLEKCMRLGERIGGTMNVCGYTTMLFNKKIASWPRLVSRGISQSKSKNGFLKKKTITITWSSMLLDFNPVGYKEKGRAM